MCKFCERNQNCKYGWDQPELENISGNVVKELKLKTVIHDYKTAPPELILSSTEFFPQMDGTEGVATAYIQIHYCPICGRKLGEKEPKKEENRDKESDKNK